jgi:hypothetical protein
MAPDEASAFFLIAARGLLFNWGACNGEYDLVAAMNLFVRKLLKGFLIDGQPPAETPEPRKGSPR